MLSTEAYNEISVKIYAKNNSPQTYMKIEQAVRNCGFLSKGQINSDPGKSPLKSNKKENN